MKIISPDATLLLLGLASIASVTQSDPQPGSGKKSKEDPSLVSRSLIYQAGETANLPCDISVPSNHAPNDELMLIMWYREDVRSPIYSIGKFGILK